MTIGKQIGPQIGSKGKMPPKIGNQGKIRFRDLFASLLSFLDLFRDLFGFLFWPEGPKPIFYQAVWIANLEAINAVVITKLSAFSKKKTTKRLRK